MGSVGRLFPPASIFPFIDRDGPPRQACRPPRAETFLSTISAAESWACGGRVSAPVAREMASTVKIQAATVFRNMDHSLIFLLSELGAKQATPNRIVRPASPC